LKAGLVFGCWIGDALVVVVVAVVVFAVVATEVAGAEAVDGAAMVAGGDEAADVRVTGTVSGMVSLGGPRVAEGTPGRIRGWPDDPSARRRSVR
jgi:hypothetical protein